jgi:hypothetical protein
MAEVCPAKLTFFWGGREIRQEKDYSQSRRFLIFKLDLKKRG